MTGPSVLVLDEPTEGIQPSIVSDIRRLILELKGQFTIILIEQYVDFAKEVCDEFIVLARGQIGAAGQVSELNSNIEQQFLKG
jgi:urea transport system ATP-binding protein